MFWCFEQSGSTINRFSFPCVINRTSLYFITASILAIMSILIGFTPEDCFWQSLYPGVGFVAYSQDLTDVQINKYAKAVLVIEVQRKQAYSTIQSILGKTPSEIICNKPETLVGLTPEAQKVAVNYCTTAKKAVESSGLTVAEFNSITQKIRTNPHLEKRIQDAMVKLQKK